MRSEITNKNNNSNNKNCEKEWKKKCIALVGQYKSLIYALWKSGKKGKEKAESCLMQCKSEIMLDLPKCKEE